MPNDGLTRILTIAVPDVEARDVIHTLKWVRKRLQRSIERTASTNPIQCDIDQRRLRSIDNINKKIVEALESDSINSGREL